MHTHFSPKYPDEEDVDFVLETFKLLAVFARKSLSPLCCVTPSSPLRDLLSADYRASVIILIIDLPSRGWRDAPP